MANIKPFKALRPQAQLAKLVASRPYDVLSSSEAKVEAQGNPASFLHITKSEIDLPDTIDVHAQEVYNQAKSNLQASIQPTTIEPPGTTPLKGTVLVGASAVTAFSSTST